MSSLTRYQIAVTGIDEIFYAHTTSHRSAARMCRHTQPGDLLMVSDQITLIRYRVDAIGRLVEQSRYEGKTGVKNDSGHTLPELPPFF